MGGMKLPPPPMPDHLYRAQQQALANAQAFQSAQRPVTGMFRSGRLMAGDKAFEITVEFNTNRVTQAAQDVIDTVLRRAAAEITSKCALLSSPGTVEVTARQYIDGTWTLIPVQGDTDEGV